MPPIRRTGPQGPRPSRRPRVAGTRPTGPADAAAPTDSPLTTDATPTAPAVPEEHPAPAAPDPAPAAQDPAPAPSVVEPGTATPTPAPVLRKPRPAVAAAPEPVAAPPTPEDDAVLPDAPASGKPATEETATQKTATGGESPVARPGPRRAVLVGMAVLTVLLAAFAVVAAQQPGVSGGASDNTALVDRPATDEAAAAAVAAVQRTYSYSFGTIDADLAAAVALMTPEMAAEHEQNFATIRDAVTQAQTTTTAQVTADGVRYLDGERAEVVAFVVVSGDNAGVALSAVPLRFSVVLTRVDGSWKMSELTQS